MSHTEQREYNNNISKRRQHHFKQVISLTYGNVKEINERKLKVSKLRYMSCYIEFVDRILLS